MKVKDMNHVMKEAVIGMNPVLECPFADGEYFEDDFYMSVRCSPVDGSCSYRSSGKEEYKCCKILKDRSN